MILIKRKKLFISFIHIVISVFCALVLFVLLNRFFLLSNFSFDCTEEKIFTISKATRQTIQAVEEPISIRFYCTPKSKYISQAIQQHYKEIINLLQNYQVDHKVMITIMDPEQTSYAQMNAQIDGIKPQQYDNLSTWCGLAVSCGHQTIPIAFLYPEEFDQLEYELTRIIGSLTMICSPTGVHKKTIGVYSPLPIGGRAAPPAESPSEQAAQPLPPWYFLQDLNRDSFIVPLDFTRPLTPQDYHTILLIHPQQLTTECLYQLDQYLLAGGNLIVALDPHCIADRQLNPASEGVVARLPSSSTFSPFLTKWGISFSKNDILADMTYKSVSQGKQTGFFPTLLSIPKEGLHSTHPTTAYLSRLQMPLAGAFNLEKLNTSITATILCKSSMQSTLVEHYLAEEMLKNNQQTFAIDTPREHPLIVELTGLFPSSYSRKPRSLPYAYEHKEKAVAQGKVILIADADMLYDPFCIETINRQGTTLTNYSNDNIRFLQNVLDYLRHDEHRIVLRSRIRQNRQLTKLQEYAKELEMRYGNEIMLLSHQIEQLNTEIENKKQEISQAPTFAAQQEKIKRNTPLIESMRHQRQEFILQKERLTALRSQADKIFSKRLTLWTIFGIPSCIVLVAMMIFICRWTRRKE